MCKYNLETVCTKNMRTETLIVSFDLKNLWYLSISAKQQETCHCHNTYRLQVYICVMHVKSCFGRWAVCLCACVCVCVCECGGGRWWVTELEEAPCPCEQSPSTSWSMARTSFCYHHITVNGSAEVCLFFTPKQKSWPPVELLCGGCTRRAIFLSLWDPWETHNPSSPPPMFVSITPTFPQSLSSHFPPSEARVNSRSDLLIWSPPSPPKKLFSSPFCHLLFVFRSPSCLYIPSHLLLSRPPTPTCNLPPLICRPFLQLLGKHHISFPSPLFILCCFPLLPSSKAIWRSLGPVRRPRGLVALWGDISE